MRKLKLQIQTTIDGYMGGPNGEMDWMNFNWSEDVGAYVTALMEGVDQMVLSRKLADGFIPAWESRREDAQGEPEASIEWMINTPKVIISNTLTTPPRDNTTIAGGDLTETITNLKQQPGGDLITYGGATLVRDLIGRGLIDDIYLFVNPAAIGNGLSAFPSTGAPLQYRLVEAKPFECGITALHYAPTQA